MESQFSEKRPSYQKHHRQFWLQIFMPIPVTFLLVIAVAILTTLATFGENGNTPRWAAISTIWLVIPVMVFGLIVLVVITGLIYLLARALKAVPTYTAKANYYVNRATSRAKHFSDLSVKPVLFFEGVTATLKAIFRRN